MNTPGYSRGDVKLLGQLLHRASHLHERTHGKPGLSYDRLELAALKWAFEVISESRGPLPEDLERVRQSLSYP
jgi:hypothetical protein